MNIVSRDEWGARGTQSRYGRMRLPARAVWLHHTVTSVSKDPHADMRQIESVGMQRFGQFSYSFCVHPNGTILEGAGLLIGAHTAKQNSTSFGIALIGNYQDRGVTVWQLDAVRWLIDRLIKADELIAGIYPTGGHRDVKATACPGEKAYRLLDAFRVPWAEPAPVLPPEGVPVANAPFAAILVHPNGGYLEIGEDGGIFAWGDAPFYGSLGDTPLNQPIVDAAWTPTYEGYFLLGRDGGVFTFGDAKHAGNALWMG